MRTFVLASLLAVALSACSTPPDVTPEEAARADCERRQVPQAQMQACLEETEDTIREARELQRIRNLPQSQNTPR